MKHFILLSLIFSLQQLFASADSSYLNNFIEKYNKKRAYYLGPNCFATALSATNVLPYSGYVDGRQFQLLMESPLCERVEANEDLKRGDILLVYSQTKETRNPVHASVYINSTTVFEKASNSAMTTPQMTKMKESLAPYTNDIVANLRKGSNQKAYISAHRCMNFKDFLKNEYPTWYDEHQRMITTIFLRDKKISDMVARRKNSDDVIRLTTNSLNSSLRALQFTSFEKNFERPHKLGRNEKIWAKADPKVRAIFQMRFTDQIQQMQYLLYANILSRAQ